MSDFESMEYDSEMSEMNMDTASDLEDETLNPGPWFPVFDIEDFYMPEMQEFRGNRLGPVDVRPDDKPHELFLSMVTDPENVDNNVVDLLVKETNRYAEDRKAVGNLKPRSRLHMWRPVNNEEMKAFLGLLLLMGIIQKPTLASYSETQDKLWLRRTPSFRSVMTRDRFLAILSNLHINNNQTALPRDHPQLGRDICVDERIVGFKGRHNIVQYISKKKSHQWGAKVWVLSESDTGYTEQLQLYFGRRNRQQPYPHGVGYSVVTELVEPHYNKFHHVTTDSLFTSPKLTHDLLGNGTYSTGTVLAGRKGMPLSFKTLKTPKGTVNAKKQGNILAIHWSDRRQVRFLTSSDHCRLETASNSKGKEKVAPGVVHTYNENMGGVDLGDQLLSVYDPDIRSVKLWKKILVNLLLTACMNAYICHKRSFLLGRKLTHLQFQQDIVTGLVGGPYNSA
ncbi:piggyBac transposable element-derived protein 4-like [Mytilus edulis]|uniref:piggyBac transposable element-derived protein 4-like n=1 Tax=Mytilus edulis TaxID=6550 RepID=UPI0039F0D088